MMLLFNLIGQQPVELKFFCVKYSSKKQKKDADCGRSGADIPAATSPKRQLIKYLPKNSFRRDDMPPNKGTSTIKMKWFLFTSGMGVGVPMPVTGL
jgi:hypothetical protein